MGIYKAYDIRGIYDEEWNRDEAYRIGLCLSALLEADEIAIGRDARTSSDEIFDALSTGIVESGCHVMDIGRCSTPSLYFATAFYAVGGSVMITASHNPPAYNGLKISGRNALPVGYDDGLNRLEKMVADNPRPGDSRGKIRIQSIRADYLEHLKPFMEGIGDISAVIDCSDGMGSIFLNDVISRLPARLITMYDTPDGRFPHHDPNPLDEANLADLKRQVLADKTDLGICFDGDADRVMFVDEATRFVSPDLIIPVLGLSFGERLLGQSVTYDVRSSRSVVEYIEKLGGRPEICQVGHSYAKRMLRKTDGLFGGELAGHYYFKDNYFCDSGMIAALLVLKVLSHREESLSELIASISRYHSSGEINFQVEDKDGVIEKVKKEYSDGKLTDIDGIRLDYATWWFSLRKSNTEPFLRLVVEAQTERELSEKTAELTSKITP